DRDGSPPSSGCWLPSAPDRCTGQGYPVPTCGDRQQTSTFRQLPRERVHETRPAAHHSATAAGVQSLAAAVPRNRSDCRGSPVNWQSRRSSLLGIAPATRAIAAATPTTAELRRREVKLGALERIQLRLLLVRQHSHGLFVRGLAGLLHAFAETF